MNPSDIYVISVVDYVVEEIGVQHIRHGWGATISVAVKLAKEYPHDSSEEDIVTAFETNQCYKSPDGKVVVITQPASID